MIDLTTWVPAFLKALNERFGQRVWFVGLQGSYGRGEETEASDIDMVVILEEMTAADLEVYRALLDTLPHREKLCGFFSGKTEILNWDAADLFQFYHDTTPLQGSLDELLLRIDDAAVSRAIHLGACNLYHGCVHNRLHGQSEQPLKGLYKAAAFVVQAIGYQQTGEYIRHQTELLNKAQPQERAIVQTFLAMKQGEKFDFEEASNQLFTWCQKWINP